MERVQTTDSVKLKY
ncbi:hypothetical protein AB3S75_003720 [Citrus x aurantiifolia]